MKQCITCGRDLPRKCSKFCSYECKLKNYRSALSCRTCDGQIVALHRRIYCSDECDPRFRRVLRAALVPAAEKVEDKSTPTPWMTLDFPGADVLWRRAKSWRPHSRSHTNHLYEFEIRLTGGRVVKAEIIYEGVYPDEVDLRKYLNMLITNLLDTPIKQHVERMLGR